MNHNKLTYWLWGIAIFSVFILIGILGWRGFFGFVIPQANSAAALPLTGVVGFSLIAGVLTFFAPCPFSVFPAYAAFFLAEDDHYHSTKTKAISFAINASVGVIGFYIVLGLILASLGTRLAFYINYLKIGVIALIFLFGLSLLFEKQLPTSFLDRLTNKLSTRVKHWGALGYGVIYAIAGAACFLPVILTIALIPILAGNFISGLAAFIGYGIAISAMLTIATFILASGRQKLLQVLVGKAAAVKKLSGAVLIASAIFLISFYIQTGM